MEKFLRLKVWQIFVEFSLDLRFELRFDIS